MAPPEKKDASNVCTIDCNKEKEKEEKPEEAEGPEIILVDGAFSWSIPFTEEGPVGVTLKPQTKGDLVWTGPAAKKPDPETAKNEVMPAVNTLANTSFVDPLKEGWPSMKIHAGGDIQAFGKEWEKGKENKASVAIGEFVIGAIDFQMPGSKNPFFTVGLKADVASIDCEKPLQSAIGKLTGSGEMVLFSKDWQVLPHLKIKGGVSVVLEVSAGIITFQDVLEGIALDILIPASFIIAGVLSIYDVVNAFATVDMLETVPGQLKAVVDAYVSSYVVSFEQNQGPDSDPINNPTAVLLAARAGSEDGYKNKKLSIAQFFKNDWDAQEAWCKVSANDTTVRTNANSAAMIHFQTEIWKKLGTGMSKNNQQNLWLKLFNVDPKTAGQLDLFLSIANKSGSSGFLSGVW